MARDEAESKHEREFKRVGPNWILRKLYQRGESRYWYGHIRDERTGQVKWRSTGETNKRRAEQVMLAWIRELEKAEKVQTRGIGFEEAFKEYLSFKQVRSSTMRDYKQTFEAVFTPTFGEQLVSEIEPKDVDRFLKTWHKRKKVLSARTRQKYLTELRAFFRWAKRNSYCAKDPTEGARIGRVAKRHGVALTPEEAHKLLKACRDPIVTEVTYSNRAKAEQEYDPPKHLELAVLIALHTGLRRGNVVRLRWGQIDLDKGRLKIPPEQMKGNHEFVTAIHPELSEELRRRLKGRRKINPKRLVLGRRLAEITKSFKSALERAGLSKEVRWHDLRHTFATWVGQRATFVVYRALLGHSPGSVSERYFHPPFDEIKRVIETLPRLLTGFEKTENEKAETQAKVVPA